MLLNIFQCTRQPHSRELFGQNISTKKLRKSLLTCSVTQHLLHAVHKSFFAFRCIFTFFKTIKHKCCISSIFNIKMAAQKFTNFDKLLMYADMTAITIQYNKIVLNEVKDN